MDRRTFIGTLAGGLLAPPLAAGAQQAATSQRVGLLWPGGGGTSTKIADSYTEGNLVATPLAVMYIHMKPRLDVQQRLLLKHLQRAERNQSIECGYDEKPDVGQSLQPRATAFEPYSCLRVGQQKERSVPARGADMGSRDFLWRFQTFGPGVVVVDANSYPGKDKPPRCPSLGYPIQLRGSRMSKGPVGHMPGHKVIRFGGSAATMLSKWPNRLAAPVAQVDRAAVS
jgi:hypothetical protein